MFKTLILCCITCFLSCSSPKILFNKNILFIGLEPPESSENRVCGGQGWADLNMLMVREGNTTRFISFPRDTLVNVPKRGYWLINSIYYNLGNKGVKDWFSKEYGVKVDHLFVISVKDIRKLIKDLDKFKLTDKVVGEMVQNYDYDEDWVRHRHKLKWESQRQMRIQTYLERTISLSRYIKLPGSWFNSIFSNIITRTTYTDLTADDLSSLKYTLYNTERSYYIWSGEYKLADFRYSWYNKQHYVWVLKDKSYKDLITNNNTIKNSPFVYDRTNFFKVSSNNTDNGVTADAKVFRIFNSFK